MKRKTKISKANFDNYGYIEEQIAKGKSVKAPQIDTEKRNLFLKDNYDKYLTTPQRIGFTHPFPEVKKKVQDEITITTKCRGFDVRFKVRLGKVSFGGGYTCTGITTDRLDISRLLPLGGWNSHSYIDTAEAMEKAVVEMAKKHNLMICDKICSWPFAKAIVGEVLEAHVRCFEPKAE